MEYLLVFFNNIDSCLFLIKWYEKLCFNTCWKKEKFSLPVFREHSIFINKWVNVFVWDRKRVWWFNQQERLYSNFIVMLSCHNVPWGNISKYTFYVFVGSMIVYLFHHTKLFHLIWLIWSFEMFEMVFRVFNLLSNEISCW